MVYLDNRAPSWPEVHLPEMEQDVSISLWAHERKCYEERTDKQINVFGFRTRVIKVLPVNNGDEETSAK